MVFSISIGLNNLHLIGDRIETNAVYLADWFRYRSRGFIDVLYDLTVSS